jgi:hypothetical protein
MEKQVFYHTVLAVSEMAALSGFAVGKSEGVIPYDRPGLDGRAGLESCWPD